MRKLHFVELEPLGCTLWCSTDASDVFPVGFLCWATRFGNRALSTSFCINHTTDDYKDMFSFPLSVQVLQMQF